MGKNWIIIAGAGGFLADHIASRLSSEGYSVFGIGRNIVTEPSNSFPYDQRVKSELPSSALLGLLKRLKPFALVNATGSAKPGVSLSLPSIDFQRNTALNFQLLEQVRLAAPTCRFVHLSSAAVYGSPSKLPVPESGEIKPLSPYGFHKWASEIITKEFSQVYGLATVSARIFSAYGPGLTQQLIWDLANRAKSDGELKLRGTGTESRDYIHAIDAARAVVMLIQSGRMDGEVYNIGSGVETSIRKIASTVGAYYGITQKPSFDGHAAAGSPLCWQADITKLKLLGFAPSIGLNEGLKETLSWIDQYLNQRSKITA